MAAILYPTWEATPAHRHGTNTDPCPYGNIISAPRSPPLTSDAAWRQPTPELWETAALEQRYGHCPGKLKLTECTAKHAGCFRAGDLICRCAGTAPRCLKKADLVLEVSPAKLPHTLFDGCLGHNHRIVIRSFGNGSARRTSSSPATKVGNAFMSEIACHSTASGMDGVRPRHIQAPIGNLPAQSYVAPLQHSLAQGREWALQRRRQATTPTARAP